MSTVADKNSRLIIISELSILQSHLYPVKKFLLHTTSAIHLMTGSTSIVEQQQDDKKIWERRE